MKMYLKGLIIILLLMPFVNHAQNISSTLRYINDQFDQYNEYETSFRVDESTKELICKDKFGTLKAKFKDIDVRSTDKNIGIYCLNDDKCIRYYDEDDIRKLDQDYRSYTMGLRENGELIPHAQTVLDKFAEIKGAVLSNHSSLGSSNSLQKDIETELQKINAIFQRSSQYNNTYSVNYSIKSIISSTKSCNTIIPVKLGLSLKDYKRGTEGYVFGYYFENSDKSILESCTSFEDYTEKTYEYLDNSADAKTVIRSLETIIDLLENNASPVSSSSNNSNVEAKLRYINQEFSKYNAYNTVWKIDYNKKQLIWENNFGTNYVNFDNLEIRADYENDWIGVYCLAGDKCITQNTSSGSTSYYTEYTMSLNDDGKIIGHVSTIIKEFEAIKKEILGGSPPKTSSGGGSLDDPD